ncbi:RNA polymerase III RPC4-domain-containing protein [Circinella umbellata]|nr:RNA polymerase III RPC4-domain-containing protein [Circinella umbellata]
MKFKPTVPTRRNKKEVTASAIDEKLKSEGGDRGRGRGRGRGAGRGRGRGRGGPMDVVAQTTASGFFSLGPSAMSSRARQFGSGGGGYTHGGDASGNRHEPESSEASDMINLFADGGHDGMLPVVFQHVSRTAGELDPSDLTTRRDKIPWLEVKSKKPALSAIIKKDPVKQEPLSDDEDKMDMDRKPDTGTDDEEEESNNTQPLLMDDDAPAQNIFGINEKRQMVSVADDELLFFQLPSVMPKFEEPIKNEKNDEEEGEGGDENGGEAGDEEKNKKKDEDVEMKDKVKLEKGLPPAAKIPALEEAMQSLELSEMPEGQIGKLVVYKSGKMKLKVGDILLDVQQGMRSSFLEDVMVVDTESDDKKKVIELGHIVQKFVCMPDLDALLEGEE